jgi:hypothetical protein
MRINNYFFILIIASLLTDVINLSTISYFTTNGVGFILKSFG